MDWHWVAIILLARQISGHQAGLIPRHLFPSRYSISAWLGKLAIVASMLDIYLEVTGANSFSYRASYICDTCNSIATPEQFTEQASWPACNPLHWACVVVERHRRHEAADTTFVPRQRDSQNPTLNWKEGQENCCVGS